MKKLDKITPISENFARWYVDVIKNGELIEYGPIKGTIIFKPNAFEIWENIKTILDIQFKKKGIRNVYLPTLIPDFFIKTEKEHIKGFAPELVTVTHVGEKKLHDKLYIRPTSEVLFADLFKRSINSYKDLPILYNQWTSVMRWEKTTNPFLRNTEFLWHEGHTIHSNAADSRKFAKDMLWLYKRFFKQYLAIPVIVGKKTNREKFAGAFSTYTLEAMMKDGKALQSATSHYLAQNFSKSFKIRFKNDQNEDEFGYQTSFGLSTRIIGALIMTHGDDYGLIIPPKVAPIQVDILEFFSDKSPKIAKTTNFLEKKLSKKFRVRVDKSDEQPGFKSARSEIRGVPLRIDIGPKDVENDEVTLVRRDTHVKTKVKITDVKKVVFETLEKIQKDLYENAKKRLYENIVIVKDYETFKEKIAENHFVLAPFSGDDHEEARIQEETGATARCIPSKFYDKSQESFCMITKKPTRRFVIFAKSY
ncbi:proline--tRNA ligase [Mesomycoplasma neurolyticum]|uniref:Proline--tRNA ligase n=1 Tax=Mesomycoplasma neurolyticum TaxID=2120 RepID=A0A449A4A2_9BACT|nr:proline--tRNA ligase [Mesomycoplasma neurolyticum]VEU59081.1 Proline--tRNA ligase [Mesomycoplasma neurolyticum]